MATKRERLPIRYPDDGMRILDVVMDKTLSEPAFAARVRGARMRAVGRYIDTDETGRIVREGYVVEAIFSEERQEEQLQHGWGTEREEMLVPA